MSTDDSARVPRHIRPTAIGVVRRGDRLLVYDNDDPGGLGTYSRPIGGGIEPGEMSWDAVVREFREETGWELVDVRLLTVVEWAFDFRGRRHHQIVFVYEGNVTEPEAYDCEPFVIEEPNEETVIGRWRPLSDFDGDRRLIPDGLLDLLRDGVDGSEPRIED